MASGEFRGAEEILNVDFNLRALDAATRNEVFTANEDEFLKQGRVGLLREYHSDDSIKKRCEYLGIEYQ
ncbi:hypothetical protein HDU91_001582 [Kappamyces sp. JEL0680]|nr:hypothetical protein HDU91_001582 [Kappamyces sp. JEL0680]